MPDDMLWLCDVVEGLCLPPPRWVWAKDNWWGQPEGSPVADADLGVCEGFRTSASRTSRPPPSPRIRRTSVCCAPAPATWTWWPAATSA
ncbi:hypothetical protein WJ972_13315 [Achromobacter insuavis]